MCTLTSSRAPVRPTGAPMPSCSSTTKSCGSTCRISRPAGSDTARAASIARRTSSRVTSRFLPATATTPRLLKPLMCGPLSAEMHRADLDAGHQLGFLDRPLDRLDRGVEIDHDAALQPLRLGDAEADDVDAALVDELADDGADLRGPDVEPHHVALVSCQHVLLPPSHPTDARPSGRRRSAPQLIAASRRPRRPGARDRPHIQPLVEPHVDVVDVRRRARAAPARDRGIPGAVRRNRARRAAACAVSPSSITTASCASLTSICETCCARSGRASSAAISRAASCARVSSIALAPLARPRRQPVDDRQVELGVVRSVLVDDDAAARRPDRARR